MDVHRQIVNTRAALNQLQETSLKAGSSSQRVFKGSMNHELHGYVGRMEEMRSACGISVGNMKERGHLGDPELDG
jgi:hypothetical protein